MSTNRREQERSSRMKQTWRPIAFGLPLILVLFSKTCCAAKTNPCQHLYPTFIPYSCTNAACKSCPVGTGVAKFCNGRNATVCEDCSSGVSYSSRSNPYESCRRVSKCPSDQIVFKNPTAASDTQCQCRSGYSLDSLGICHPDVIQRPSPTSQHEHTTTAETLDTTSYLSVSPTARTTKSTAHKVSKISDSARDSFTNLSNYSSHPSEATSAPGSSSVLIISVVVSIVSVIGLLVALVVVVYRRRQRFPRVRCCLGSTGLPDKDKVDEESELLTGGEHNHVQDEQADKKETRLPIEETKEESDRPDDALADTSLVTSESDKPVPSKPFAEVQHFSQHMLNELAIVMQARPEKYPSSLEVFAEEVGVDVRKVKSRVSTSSDPARFILDELIEINPCYPLSDVCTKFGKSDRLDCARKLYELTENRLHLSDDLQRMLFPTSDTSTSFQKYNTAAAVATDDNIEKPSEEWLDFFNSSSRDSYTVSEVVHEDHDQKIIRSS
ncbi:uncharacterized protein LOC134189755 isoform X1 [Corticium candelabrum]|uniref:uncharacterized protein LOC134189755 isoform X1 n=1 Tax=Corticium candelabrum TaxID=121492 RepID=UPI002E267375|nr:uncharacterized protein LOC134189755 isoform X1 [Corticium candelabrum]